jgi:hypothetical protein
MLREMLYRRTYHGELVWGATTHVDRNGRARVPIRCDESRLVVVPAPDLEIVPAPLWTAVQQRLAMLRETYLRDWHGKLWAKPNLGRTGRYLLTDLARCGVCGGHLVVRGNTPRVYGCARYGLRGTCRNGLAQPVALMDAAFLGALEREVLTPERFRVAVQAGVERVRQQLWEEPDRGAALTRERESLTRKIQRMVAAIGDGKGPKTLVAEIAKAEARSDEITAELARLDAGPALARLDLQRMEREIAGQLARFADLLKGNVLRARQALKKLLVDRAEFTPVPDAQGGQTYAFRAELAYGAVLEQAIYTSKIPDWTPSV